VTAVEETGADVIPKVSTSRDVRGTRSIGNSVQLELEAREHIDIGTGRLTHTHTNRRDVEQCRASVNSSCVTSNP